VKQEDYETKEGITGLKAYGTFTRENELTNEKDRMYYEILLFAQEGGLQQILILHQEGDKYANEISERVLSSVELKQEGR